MLTNFSSSQKPVEDRSSKARPLLTAPATATRSHAVAGATRWSHYDLFGIRRVHRFLMAWLYLTHGPQVYTSETQLLICDDIWLYDIMPWYMVDEMLLFHKIDYWLRMFKDFNHLLPFSSHGLFKVHLEWVSYNIQLSNTCLFPNLFLLPSWETLRPAQNSLSSSTVSPCCNSMFV